MIMTEYTLKAVPIASLPLPGWECFFGQNDTKFYDAIFYVWIVRNDGVVGLIDTGLPLSKPDQKTLIDASKSVDERCVFSDIVPLDRVLDEEGISVEEIDFVAITQPITYHTGGLVSSLFPKARVFISRAGFFEFLTENVGHPPRQFYFTESSWSFLYRLLLENRICLVDEITEILPGILFETTGGHHPGSAGLRIDTSKGKVGILETAFFQKNIDEILPIGIAEDVALCRKAIKRFRNLCDIVVADHEPANSLRFNG